MVLIREAGSYWLCVLARVTVAAAGVICQVAAAGGLLASSEGCLGCALRDPTVAHFLTMVRAPRAQVREVPTCFSQHWESKAVARVALVCPPPPSVLNLA